MENKTYDFIFVDSKPNHKTRLMKYMDLKKQKYFRKNLNKLFELEAKLRETFFPFISPIKPRFSEALPEKISYRIQKIPKFKIPIKLNKATETPNNFDKTKVLDLIHGFSLKSTKNIKKLENTTTDCLLALKNRRTERIMNNIVLLLDNKNINLTRNDIICSPVKMKIEKMPNSRNNEKLFKSQQKIKKIIKEQKLYKNKYISSQEFQISSYNPKKNNSYRAEKIKEKPIENVKQKPTEIWIPTVRKDSENIF